jgi:hypothetical protein
MYTMAQKIRHIRKALLFTIEALTVIRRLFKEGVPKSRTPSFCNAENQFFRKVSNSTMQKTVFFRNDQFCNAENLFFSEMSNSAMQKTRFFEK